VLVTSTGTGAAVVDDIMPGRVAIEAEPLGNRAVAERLGDHLSAQAAMRSHNQASASG
jgi:hypothetical protein